MRRDNRTGLSEAAKLERDRRAHDLHLPLVSEREIAHPTLPVIASTVEEFARSRIDGAEERIVLAEDEVNRPAQWERYFVDEVGKRRIGREAQNLPPVQVTNVIGADDKIGCPLAVTVGWAHPDRDPRQAGDRFYAPNDLRWSVYALEAFKIRSKIGDTHLSAICIGQDRLDDRGVAHVLLPSLDQVRKRDIAETFFLVAGQEPREDRIGIEVGITPPHDPGVLIDKGRGAAVSDQGQVEILFFCLRALGHALVPRANSASHPRTACGLENEPIAPWRRRPTE